MNRVSNPVIAILALSLFATSPVVAQERGDPAEVQTHASSETTALQTRTSAGSGVMENMRGAVEAAKAEATAAKEAAENAEQSARSAKAEAGSAREKAEIAATKSTEAGTSANGAKVAAESAATAANEAKRAANAAEESSKNAADKVEILSNMINGMRTTSGTETVVRGPRSFPAWIAAGAGFLAVVAALLATFFLKSRIERLGTVLDSRLEKNRVATDAMAADMKALRAAVGDADLKSMVQAQVKTVSDAIRALDGKIGGFDRTVRDIPGQFDAVAKTLSRDSESHRSSILAWIFGRGKTSAPESGFMQQIEDRIGQFQTAVLAAVETDKRLQSRKLDLDDRERKLDERERNFNAERDLARAKGAEEAERKAAALEAANKTLAEGLTAKGTEFGKKVALLESERNAAKTAAQQAEAVSAAAKRQAEEAVKLREKLAADVARLTAEIASHDKSREADLAKAREEIRSELEKANANQIANLRAEARTAREERTKAEESARTLHDAKTAAETALASAKAALETEKSAHEGDRAAAARELSAEKAAREFDRKAAGKDLAAATAERDAAKARVFPTEFRNDPAFETLLGQLDNWDAGDLPGAALARASLAIFAERKNLPTKIWQRSLGDFSLGLATAMEAAKTNPAEAVALLGKWKAEIERHRSDEAVFTLRLPSVGEKTDISWMHAKAGSASVRRVLSWAVYGQAGNVYMAEVE